MAGSGDRPEDREEPSTSTSMFLRSFGAAPAEAELSDKEIASRGFRFTEDAAALPSPHQRPEAEPPAPGPGEFTRLFVRPTPSGEHERLTTSAGESYGNKVEQFPGRGRGPSAFESLNSKPATGSSPMPPTPAPPASNSSQFFSREIARPFPPPVKRPEPPLEAGYARVDPPPGSNAAPISEVTELLRDIYADQGGRSFADRSPSPDTYRDSYREPAPLPHSRQPPVSAPATPANGFTVMLDRLALEEAMGASRTASPQVPALREDPAPLPPSPATGPGEYTRVINRLELGATGAPVMTPAPPQSAAPVPLPVAAPVLQMPAVSHPAPAVSYPAIVPPVASAPMVSAPRFEAPKVAAPAPPAAPAMAAPKSKLQEMLPLLLIANAFLMIVLIVIVVFALRART